jgi:hypothetical protein
MTHEHILRRILEAEEEAEDDKLSQPTPLYLSAKVIDAAGVDKGQGARCGKCTFFNPETKECALTDPPPCDADHGVCGFFVGGEFHGDKPLKLIPKDMAGYIVDEKAVPTRCDKCEYFIADKNKCMKVKGTVEAGGCCNGYDFDDK